LVGSSSARCRLSARASRPLAPPLAHGARALGAPNERALVATQWSFDLAPLAVVLAPSHGAHVVASRATALVAALLFFEGAKAHALAVSLMCPHGARAFGAPKAGAPAAALLFFDGALSAEKAHALAVSLLFLHGARAFGAPKAGALAVELFPASIALSAAGAPVAATLRGDSLALRRDGTLCRTAWRLAGTPLCELLQGEAGRSS